MVDGGTGWGIEYATKHVLAELVRWSGKSKEELRADQMLSRASFYRLFKDHPKVHLRTVFHLGEAIGVPGEEIVALIAETLDRVDEAVVPADWDPAVDGEVRWSNILFGSESEKRVDEHIRRAAVNAVADWSLENGA